MRVLKVSRQAEQSNDSTQNTQIIAKNLSEQIHKCDPLSNEMHLLNKNCDAMLYRDANINNLTEKRRMLPPYGNLIISSVSAAFCISV